MALDISSRIPEPSNFIGEGQPLPDPIVSPRMEEKDPPSTEQSAPEDKNNAGDTTSTTKPTGNQDPPNSITEDSANNGKIILDNFDSIKNSANNFSASATNRGLGIVANAGDRTISTDDLNAYVKDKNHPEEVRSAAQHFLDHPNQITESGEFTKEDLTKYLERPVAEAASTADPRSDALKEPPAGSFAAETRGKSKQNFDNSLAKMSKDSYQDSGSNTYGGFTRLDDARATQMLGLSPSSLHQDNGLDAAIYVNDSGTSSQSDDKFVVAYRGTEVTSWSDIRTDIVQGGFGANSQYRAGIQLAKEAALGAAKWTGKAGELVFTGHSLGGGLAAAGAAATSGTAVTFNAAGLHKDTAKYAEEERLKEINRLEQRNENAGIENVDGKSVYERLRTGNMVRGYHIRGEALHTFQKTPGIPQAAGNDITLNAPGWFGMLNPLQNHKMDKVLEAMGIDASPDTRAA